MSLGGHHIVVAADTWRPYVVYPEGAGEPGGPKMEGAAFEIFHDIASRLNVT